MAPWALWIGKFHPLVVHLPIGILLLGALLLVAGQWERFRAYRQFAPLVILLGGIGALVSGGTGWLLAESGDYAAETTFWHRWLGIVSALLALAGWAGLWWIKEKPGEKAYSLGLAVLLTAGITVTGHLGGTLTHGEGFLKWPETETPEAAAAPDIRTATAYAAVVAPILEKKCVSCHGPGKQKGKLRLDGPEGIQAGGKSGKPLLVADLAQNELIHRMELDPSDEYHMPPKGRPQLTAAEAGLLRWWLRNGADFERKAADLDQTEEEAAWLAALSAGEAAPNGDFPTEEVAAAPDAALKALRDAGVVVLPLYQGSHYLQASFVAVPSAGDSVLALLAPLAEQLVALKLGGTRMTDAGLAHISDLRALRRLSLDGCALTDAGLVHLMPLRNLRWLNLTGTRVTAQGVLSLAALPELKQLYLYGTGVTQADSARIATGLKGVKVERGVNGL